MPGDQSPEQSRYSSENQVSSVPTAEQVAPSPLSLQAFNRIVRLARELAQYHPKCRVRLSAAGEWLYRHHWECPMRRKED